MASTPSISLFKMAQPGGVADGETLCPHALGGSDGARNLRVEEQCSARCKDKREHVGGAVSQKAMFARRDVQRHYLANSVCIAPEEGDLSVVDPIEEVGGVGVGFG